MMRSKVKTVKVEVRLTKPHYEAIKKYVENAERGYDDVEEFLVEAIRIHFEAVQRAQRLRGY